MKILHLNLYRKYFDAIANGTKTTEYREVTPYWSKQLNRTVTIDNHLFYN